MAQKYPHVSIIIQARMESTRLPGKVLLPVLNKPLLGYLLERVGRVKNADSIIVATTAKASDDQIVSFCEGKGVKIFRGDEDNVLNRYLQAAIAFKADVIVRITADCPLIDPAVIEKVIAYYKNHHYDYVGNTLALTYPRGMDAEAFSFDALKKAAQAAETQSEREHVTLFIYKHSETFKIANVPYSTDKSQYRLTVDTPEDFELIKKIIELLYPNRPQFNLEDIIALLEKNPSLPAINCHVGQKIVRP